MSTIFRAVLVISQRFRHCCALASLGVFNPFLCAVLWKGKEWTRQVAPPGVSTDGGSPSGPAAGLPAPERGVGGLAGTKAPSPEQGPSCPSSRQPPARGWAGGGSAITGPFPVSAVPCQRRSVRRHKMAAEPRGRVRTATAAWPAFLVKNHQNSQELAWEKVE